MTSTIPILLGISITVLSYTSFLLNFFVLFIIWKGGLLKPKRSNIYLLAFANITANIIRASAIAFYMGPSIILQKEIFPGGSTGLGNRLISYIENATWDIDNLISAVVAINRVSVIVFPESFGKIFTRNNVKMLAITLFISGFILAFISHKLMPCCVHRFYYSNYWVVIFEKEFNYSEIFIEIPFNIITSSISIICYSTVYFYVRKSYRRIDSKLNSVSSKARRKKEVRYALQFGALSMFALFAWISHRIFPEIVIFDNTNKNSSMISHGVNKEIFSLITFSVIIHSMMNSIIFLTINKEVKDSMKKYFHIIPSYQNIEPKDRKSSQKNANFSSIRNPLIKDTRTIGIS